ncbi:MAG TPA: protein kinase, partial [Abditibacteriaceae bacterium]
EDEAVYRARHRLMPASPPVRLRVVTLSPYTLSPQEQEARRDAILREAQALHLLGSHPNIAGARDSFGDDGGRLVIVFDEPKGRTLRARLGNGTPLTTTQRLDILLDVTRALSRAHEGGVIHRAVEPANVLVGDDMRARLTNFALAKMPVLASGIPGVTVWRDPDEAGLDARYIAPELSNPRLLSGGKVSPAADVWSLGCLAYEMFGPTGAPPSGNLNDLPPFDDRAPSGLWPIVQGLLVRDPAARTPDARGILTRLVALRSAGGPASPSPEPAKEWYERDDVIDGRYVVKSVLGRGGFSAVYRVYHSTSDCEFALKIFTNRDAHTSLEREFQTLRNLPSHPHVVKAVWGDRTQNGQWYLVTELAEGESLAAYAEGRKRLAPQQAVELARQLLEALEAIHRPDEAIAALKAKPELSSEEYERMQELQNSGVIHRDIKPQNLMLTPDGLKLIDFNIASRQGDVKITHAGTMPYVPPNLGVADGAVWNSDPDLFATAVVLYELLCWNLPHAHADPQNSPQPQDPRDYRPDLSSELATFLLKALSPVREERFQSAREMRLALEAVTPLLESERPAESKSENDRTLADEATPVTDKITSERVVPVSIAPAADERSTIVLSPRLRTLLENAPPNVNPMVREFLGLSSQARRSNKGTRGMDDLAEATYVETRLDADLAVSVLEGKHRLVLVTGNAGDGKTAFIQQVERSAKERGALEEERTVNRSRLRYGERAILTLYDGSQDEGERKSDAILREFLADFRPGVQPTPNTVRLAAINEGRLRDFLSSHRDEWGTFARDVIATLDDPGAAPQTDDVVVVNLNLRSVTMGEADSIFSRQLRAIVRGPFWEPCARCDYRTRCPLKHNVDTLRDETSGDAVSERLRVLVDALRLRRQRHLTMRDVRSLISHLLFRDRACEEVPALLESPEANHLLNVTYFQGIGGLGAPAQSTLERGAALLSQIDVGEVANPAQDREIASQRHIAPPVGPRLMEFPSRTADNYYAELIAESRRAARVGYEADVALARTTHAAARRRLFFERADDAWWEMLPYHRLRQFQEALRSDAAGEAARKTLLQEIVGAISLSEGAADPQAAQEALWLATGAPLRSLSAPSHYKCFRRYPLEEFVLRVREVSALYVEAQSDQLQLVHQPQGLAVPGATLDIDLDLLEMLELLREGFAPLAEGTGFGVNLRLFKNRLLAENARELFLANAGEAEDGGVLLRIAPGPGAGSVQLSSIAANSRRLG